MTELRIVGGKLDGRIVNMPDDWKTIIVPFHGENGMVDYPMFRREERGGEEVLVEVEPEKAAPRIGESGV